MTKKQSKIKMQPGGSLMLHALNSAPDEATRQDIVEAALDQSFEAYDGDSKDAIRNRH